MPSVSVVISVYIEELTRRELVDQLTQTLQAMALDQEITLVDDHSRDASLRVINELHS